MNATGIGMFSYPEALHSNGDRVRDREVVRPVKELVRSTFSEFIQKGTYKGRKLKWTTSEGVTRDFWNRKGEYHIFVILKSDEGIRKLLADSAGIFSRDNYASNLYFHMADEMITRLIFYNPILREIKNISLDIATRSSGDMDSDSPLAKDYKKQGYRPQGLEEDEEEENENKENENKENKRVHFNLTNADIYRSVIAEEILDAGQTNINIKNFKVLPINYKARAYKMEFLYLADTICSIIQFEMTGNNADEWLDCTIKKVQDFTGKTENLIFGYDEMDVLFAKAWMKYEDGDFYGALSNAYNACRRKGAFAEYYKNLWFKKLEERILESENLSHFNMAVRKLNETMNNSDLDQDKTIYILRILEQLAPKMEEKFCSPEARKVLYQLYDTGISAYCHIGDSKSAERYFEKCKELVGVISVEEYLNTRNKLVVYCCDYFELDRAQKISDENLVYQEYLTTVKNKLSFFDKEEGYFAYGKALSQNAQVHAFKQDVHAEEVFRKALANFDEKSANYKITQSYLLHHYLDMGNKEAYLKEAEAYFEGEKLADQLKYILNEGAKKEALISMKYALYIFIKGLYLFRFDELTERVWRDLQRIEKLFAKKISKKDWVLSAHPSEIIFKYMRLIAVSRGESEIEQIYAKRMAECLGYHGTTEDVIRKFGDIEVENVKGNKEMRDKLTLQLCQFLSENFAAFENLEIPQGGEERYQWLETQITYMYR